MKKYEYSVMVLRVDNSEDIKKWMDNMGRQGWELVQVVNDRFIFKREIHVDQTKAI